MRLARRVDIGQIRQISQKMGKLWSPEETSHIEFEGNFLPQVYVANAKNSLDAEALHRYNIFFF